MPTASMEKVRHEDFCLPRPGEEKPRLEEFVAYADDVSTGRSAPSKRVTRCLECGAASYKPYSD